MIAMMPQQKPIWSFICMKFIPEWAICCVQLSAINNNFIANTKNEVECWKRNEIMAHWPTPLHYIHKDLNQTYGAGRWFKYSTQSVKAFSETLRLSDCWSASWNIQISFPISRWKQLKIKIRTFVNKTAAEMMEKKKFFN